MASRVILGRGIYRDGGAPPNPSTPPLNVTTQVVGSTVIITWTNDPLAANYKVSRTALENAQSVLLAVIPAGTLTYTDNSPANEPDLNFYEVVSTR